DAVRANRLPGEPERRSPPLCQREVGRTAIDEKWRRVEGFPAATVRADQERRDRGCEIEMNRTLLVLTASAVVMLSGARAHAHHAFSAEYDANKPVEVRGTIVKVEWINPHTWFHLDVKNSDGSVDRWIFEGGSPTALLRRGFTKDFLKPG